MFFTDEISHEKIDIKKSTFIAYLIPYKLFDEFQTKLQKEHPKARHIVWAMRYLNEFEQVVENSSDDGEPKGTSGPPVLNVMRGAGLIESAILVVRYFGGIKLGTGGLVRAYGGVAKEVISQADLLEYVKKEKFICRVPYPLHSRFEHFIQKYNCEIVSNEFEALEVKIILSLGAKEKEKFMDFAQSFFQDGVKVEAL